ncbi:hypothetical protein D9M70_541070 [compost metagenome]
MIITPTRAVKLAAHVAHSSRSPAKTRASVAVMNGIAAWIVITSATGARRRALIKQMVATVDRIMTQKPAIPMARIATHRSFW